MFRQLKCQAKSVDRFARPRPFNLKSSIPAVCAIGYCLYPFVLPGSGSVRIQPNFYPTILYIVHTITMVFPPLAFPVFSLASRTRSSQFLFIQIKRNLPCGPNLSSLWIWPRAAPVYDCAPSVPVARDSCPAWVHYSRKTLPASATASNV